LLYPRCEAPQGSNLATSQSATVRLDMSNIFVISLLAKNINRRVASNLHRIEILPNPEEGLMVE